MKGHKVAVDIGCGPYFQTFEPEVGKVLRVDKCKLAGVDYQADICAESNFTALQIWLENTLGKLPEIVYCSHLLEHVGKPFDVLGRLWAIAGEELRIAVPNLEWAAKQIVEGLLDDDVLRCIYGVSPKMNPVWDKNDVHRFGFDYAHFNGLIQAACVGHKRSEIICWRNSLWARVFKV